MGFLFSGEKVLRNAQIMKTFLQHLRTGKLAPHEGSLYANVPWLWITLLQILVCLIFVVQGWMMLNGQLSLFSPLCDPNQSIQRTVCSYLDLASGYALIASTLIILLLRIPYFVVLRWVYLVACVLSVSVISIQLVGDVPPLMPFVGILYLPVMLFIGLSFPRSLRALGWLGCALLATALCVDGVAQMGLGSENGFSLGNIMGLVKLNVGVALLVPFFRRIALYGILVFLAMKIYTFANTADSVLSASEWLIVSTQVMLPVLLLMLLQTWNPSKRLTLNMLDISSQTRRILSKATILHKH